MTLRAKRINMGITEAAAAASAHIHPTAWCRYEKGRQRPTRPVAERIAQTLKTTVPELWPEGVKELGGVLLTEEDGGHQGNLSPCSPPDEKGGKI